MAIKFVKTDKLNESKQQRWIDTDVYKSNDKGGKILNPDLVDDWFDNKKAQSVDVTLYLGKLIIELKNVIMKDCSIVKDTKNSTIVDLGYRNLNGFRWVGSKPVSFIGYLKNGDTYSIRFNNYNDTDDFMREVVGIDIM